jgi:FMN phosphatase YigB (HAD superfamily)
MDFLRQTGVRPERVVFVDDKLRHVREVDKAVRAAGLRCTALRYGATDRQVAEFYAAMPPASRGEVSVRAAAKNAKP